MRSHTERPLLATAVALVAAIAFAACRHTDDGRALSPAARGPDGGAGLQHDDTTTGEPIGPMTRARHTNQEVADVTGGAPGLGGAPGSSGGGPGTGGGALGSP